MADGGGGVVLASSGSSGSSAGLRTQVAELRRVLEEANEQWSQVQGALAGLRSELSRAGPVAARPLAAAAPRAAETEPHLHNGVAAHSAPRAEPAPIPHGFADHTGPPSAPLEVPAVPPAKPSGRRTSAFAATPLSDVGQACAALGGRVITVETGSPLLGDLECVVVEPAGKQVAPQAFVSAGLIVCLQGMPSSPESLEEWCQAAVIAGWLNLGASVAMPNLQMNSALGLEDLEAVLKGTLKKVGFERCLLVGKDWGGVIAVDLASRSSLAEQIEGIVLVGPNTPAPATAGEVAVPVLLLWARDDDVSPFEDWEEWMQALDERCMPTTIKDCPTGGHRFDTILRSPGLSEAVKHFTTSSFCLSALDAVEEGDEEDEEEEDEKRSKHQARKEDSDSASEEEELGGAMRPAHSLRLTQRLTRLQAELPGFLQVSSPQVTLPTEELPADASPLRPKRLSNAKRLSLALPQWINAGMTQASE